MTIPFPEVSRKGALALRGLGEIRKYVGQHDALVIGPGLGAHHETRELIRRLIPNLDKPSIIDADGINAFEDAVDLLRQRDNANDLVLTPHPGEFARLTGTEVPNDVRKKITCITQTAHDLSAVIVLKGSPTLIAEPHGACYLNPTGNAGMATGGSGDVLSGIIGSFLAQGLSPLDAALCGVYLHGLAGDLAAEQFTERAQQLHQLKRSVNKADVIAAKEAGLAGASVFRGILSYGASKSVEVLRTFTHEDDKSVVIEIVDSRKNLKEFLPALYKMMDESKKGGLVTLQKLDVLRYKREKQFNPFGSF